MHLSRIVLLCTLLLPGLASAQQGSPGLSTRLSPPERVEGFRLVSIRQIEGGGGGHMRYRSGDGVELDAYLYPLPVDPGCLQACDSVAVSLEADAFALLIPDLVRRGEFDSLRVEGDSAVSVRYAGGTAHGRHLRMRGAAGGKAVRSHLVLYGMGNLLARVRATVPPGAKNDGLPVRFASGFVRLTAGAPSAADACAGGPADPEDVRRTADSRLDVPVLRRRVAPVLAALGFTPAPGAGAGDTWETEPVAGWPAGIDYAGFAREESPGFAVSVRLKEGAAGTLVTVSARALCAPVSASHDPKGLETSLELLTAGQVLAKLDPSPRTR